MRLQFTKKSPLIRMPFTIQNHEPTTSYSKLVTMGAEHGLFHNLLRSTTEAGSGKRRRMADMSGCLQQARSMDSLRCYRNARPFTSPRIADCRSGCFCNGTRQRFKRWFNEVYWNCRPSVSDGTGKSWWWQEGCFDRLLRSDESFSEKWDYPAPKSSSRRTEPKSRRLAISISIQRRFPGRL